MEQRFDAIVVGAGPAGCACGYKLAQGGLQVLVVERGKFAGAKNMWGGAFFGAILGELLPDFWEEAPIERYVARRKLSLLANDALLSLEFTREKLGQPPNYGFIVLRSKFDRWFAAKAEEAGAILASGLKADGLVFDGNQIVGIEAGGDELQTDVVVACDGVNSVLAEQAGLKRQISPRDFKQGVKEVIALPPEIIERRFNLSGDEGIAWEFIGSCTRGLPGGAFIYTNRESLSVGIIVQLSALIDSGVRAADLLNEFKEHSAVSKFLDGGKVEEYSAHLIPVSGVNMMPTLYTDGLIVAGDGAAFVVGTGLILEGANFAVASGIAAARTVIRAKERHDYSAKSLSYYEDLLEQSFVLKDLKTFRKAPDFLESPRIYSIYPELACDLVESILCNGSEPRKKTWRVLRDVMEGRVTFGQLASDVIRMRGAI